MDKNMKIYIGIAVIVIVIAVLAYIYFSSSGNSSLVTYDNKLVPASQISQLYIIANNQALAQAVGQGAIVSPPLPINGTPLFYGNKPGMLYVGAEYCPFCAATRWSMVLALMRFGNLTNLHYMTSSSSDIYPSTPTFTFYNSTYSSSVIDFVSVETTTNTRTPLQVPNSTVNVTFSKYDTAGIPFIDFGNKYIQSGAAFTPGLLANSNWAQVISQLSNGNATVTQAIIGEANIFTAKICSIDNMKPQNVCSQPYINSILNRN